MPQLRHLGRSRRAHVYGLTDLDEAARYLAHPVLGPRLIEMCDALRQHAGTPPERVLGDIDALKVRSCATLFACLPSAPAVFSDLLDEFYGGTRCSRTLDLVG